MGNGALKHGDVTQRPYEEAETTLERNSRTPQRQRRLPLRTSRPTVLNVELRSSTVNMVCGVLTRDGKRRTADGGGRSATYPTPVH
jgi:hypothetical protein